MLAEDYLLYNEKPCIVSNDSIIRTRRGSMQTRHHGDSITLLHGRHQDQRGRVIVLARPSSLHILPSNGLFRYFFLFFLPFKRGFHSLRARNLCRPRKLKLFNFYSLRFFRPRARGIRYFLIFLQVRAQKWWMENTLYPIKKQNKYYPIVHCHFN